MNELTVNNLQEFLFEYHYFHDSQIKKIKYDIAKNEITLKINVAWTGESSVKEDGFYQTNPCKMEIVFKDIYKFRGLTIDSWEIISKCFMESMIIKDQHLLSFRDDEEEPSIEIICKQILYKCST